MYVLRVLLDSDCKLMYDLLVGFAARTKVGDPAFLNDTTEIDNIPTKE